MGARKSLTVLGAIVVLAGVTATCGGKTSLPICGGSTGGECTDPQDVSKAVCTCTCSSSFTSRSLNIALGKCYPNFINASVTPLSDIKKNVSAQQYTDAVAHICDDVQDTLNLAIPMLVDACGLTGTPCTCVHTGIDGKNPGCATACPTMPTFCTRTNLLTCNAAATSCASGPIVCRPPPGSFDPPDLPGVIEGLFDQQSTLDIDPMQSTFNLQVFLQGDAGPPQANVSPKVHGTLTTYGTLNDDGTADVLVDLGATIEDASFTVQNVNANLTKMHAYGGLQDLHLHVDANGNAQIDPHKFKMILDVLQNGSPTRLTLDNQNTVLPIIDYANKKWSIPSIFFNNQQGITGNFALGGKITNQPPHARTKPDQLLECTSPAGASVTLDGSPTTDADGDYAFFSWQKGPGLRDVDVIARTQSTTTTAPLGSTLFTFSVGDGSFQTALASTTIKVQDTTAPVLMLGTPQPECLWAPNHKIVLYELGKTLPFTVKDTCDPNPIVQILDVTSNQPNVGGGQGDFTPDFTNGKTGLCLRSERQGTVMWDRQYTVRVQTTDAANNTSIKSVVVRVPHDQAGATKCPNIDPARYVDITDPRCTAN